jgi:Ca2+-binding RTX toxin-like protein
VKSFFAGTGSADATNPIQRIYFQGPNITWDLAKIAGLVTGQDTAPQLVKPLLDQSVKQGAVLAYSVPADAFVDNDAGDVLTYSAKLADSMPLPAWLSFNPATRTFSGTAPTGYLDTLNVKVFATDKAGNVASDVFDLAVVADHKTLTGTAAAEALVGASGNDTLYGLAGNDTLMGNDGNDRLDGGAGLDSMVGGTGSDTYVVDAVGDITIDSDGPLDTIESSVSLTLPTGIESLVLTGSVALDGTGNESSNLIVGNVGNNRLDGGAAPTHWLYPSNDTLRGGAGNDTYVIRTQAYTTTTVEELAGEGVDTIEFTSSSSAFTLPGQVENLILKGTSMVGSGNQLNNTITGNDANNMLSGVEGADTLFGLGGNDTLEGGLELGDYGDVMDGGLGDDTYRYQLGSGQDVIVESLPDARVGKLNTLFVYGRGPASDAIPASLKRVGVDLEVWVGTGTDKVTIKSFFAGTGPDNPLNPIQRIDFANGTKWDIPQILSLVTSAPANTAPKLITALADQAAKQGAAINYTVPSGAFTDADAGDVLTYTATLATGAALPSWLAFNPSTRAFTGTAPTATVGNTSIKVTATDKAGAAISDVFDVVVSAENRILTGTTAAETLTGYSGHDTLNAAAGNDTLVGNAGNDRLNGGTGADSMTGGVGNDTYVVDNTGDKTIESASGGIDVIETSISWTLGADIENMVLTGSAAINGTGNGLSNGITGNAGNNLINGAGGHDTLNGAAGADTLDGGTGNDIYLFTRGDGQDTIQEATADATAGKLNVLRFRNTVTAADVSFKKVGTDLEVLIGTEGDKVTVKGFYTGIGPLASTNPLQQIEFSADGTKWDIAAIQARVPAQQSALVSPSSAGATASILMATGVSETSSQPSSGTRVTSHMVRRGVLVDEMAVDGAKAAEAGAGVEAGADSTTAAVIDDATAAADSSVSEAVAATFTVASYVDVEANADAEALADTPFDASMDDAMATADVAATDAFADSPADSTFIDRSADAVAEAAAALSENDAQQATWQHLQALMNGERRWLPERVSGLGGGDGVPSGDDRQGEADLLRVAAHASLALDSFDRLDAVPMLLDSQLHSLLSAMAAFSPPAAGETTLANHQPVAWKGELAVNWNA